MIPALADLVFPINALPAYQLVREGIDQLSHDADKKKEAVLEYYSRVDADLLFCFSDIVIQSEAMGARIQFFQDGMPAVSKPAAQISLPRAADVPRMQVNEKTIQALAQTFPGRKTAGMVYGPFTVAGQLAGEQKIMKSLRKEPETVLNLLEKCTCLAIDYAHLLVNAGASVVWVSDPFASLLSAKDFSIFARDGLADIFNAFSDLPTAVHICGDTTHLIGPIIDTGVDAISFDQCMQLHAIEDQVPDHICIMGNIDPVQEVAEASEQMIDDLCRDQVFMMGTASNYSPSTGCALPVNTPVENVIRFIDASRKYLSEIMPQREALRKLNRHVYAGEKEKTETLASTIISGDINPEVIIHAGLMRAIRKASALYEQGACYLPDLLLMTDAFYSGFAAVKDQLPKAGSDIQVVLGVVEGDFHEIGKDIVKAILEANGIRVLDLGTSVRAMDFESAAQTTGAPVLALSAFTTASRKQIQKISSLFKEKKHPAAIIAGGAALSKSMAAELGADGYARDAVGALKLVKQITSLQNK